MGYVFLDSRGETSVSFCFFYVFIYGKNIVSLSFTYQQAKPFIYLFSNLATGIKTLNLKFAAKWTCCLFHIGPTVIRILSNGLCFYLLARLNYSWVKIPPLVALKPVNVLNRYLRCRFQWQCKWLETAMEETVNWKWD